MEGMTNGQIRTIIKSVSAIIVVVVLGITLMSARGVDQGTIAIVSAVIAFVGPTVTGLLTLLNTGKTIERVDDTTRHVVETKAKVEETKQTLEGRP